MLSGKNKEAILKTYLIVNLFRNEVQHSYQCSNFIGLDGQRGGIDSGMQARSIERHLVRVQL